MCDETIGRTNTFFGTCTVTRLTYLTTLSFRSRTNTKNSTESFYHTKPIHQPISPTSKARRLIHIYCTRNARLKCTPHWQISFWWSQQNKEIIPVTMPFKNVNKLLETKHKHQKI